MLALSRERGAKGGEDHFRLGVGCDVGPRASVCSGRGLVGSTVVLGESRERVGRAFELMSLLLPASDAGAVGGNDEDIPEGQPLKGKSFLQRPKRR